LLKRGGDGWTVGELGPVGCLFVKFHVFFLCITDRE
jgi:hypothetical protein